MRAELDQCLQLAKKITEKNEQIYSLKVRTTSPKNQVFSDTPRGGTVENAFDQYLFKLERLDKIKKVYEDKRKFYWNTVKKELEAHGMGDNKELRMMLYYRFFCGFSWKRCAKQLGELYTESKWNTNKCFRIYRRTLNKIDKND